MEEEMANLYNDSAPAFSSNSAKSTLTAFFDSRSDADTAIERLKEAGVADARLLPGYEADADKSDVGSDDRGGFFAALTDWFLPDEDRSVYAEGLRRGGVLVSASVDDATYDTAHDILDDTGSIDMDERADLWKADGWSSQGADRVLEADAAAGAATGIGSYSRSAQPTSPRVRAYELDSELPSDIRDDVLPTGHQRDVSEGQKGADIESSVEMGGLRPDPSFPRGR
jgi:hypothetical protein